MNELRVKFENDGYLVVPNLLSELDLSWLSEACDKIASSKAGTRSLLGHEWARCLSKQLLASPVLASLLPQSQVAVQCTYFSKSTDTNWLVPIHQDRSIPVRKPFDSPDWSGWSIKEGVHFVNAPDEVLRSLVAIRLHLEENTVENGALQVIPGSHLCKPDARLRMHCEVPRGGALLMKPLLHHSSSKLQTGVRRVLHFLYGPKELPYPAEWAYAV